jgi:hypothetical protein
MHIIGVDDRMIIHPRWLMDEYARIVRRFVWFSPIIPPIVVPVIAISVVCFGSDLEMYEKDRRIRGAIFCHVERIKQFVHERDDITDGNHKWHGAAPSFSRSDVIRITVAKFLSIRVLIIIDDPRRSSMDPSAWDKKYLIAASVSWFDLDWSIIGINLSMLISSMIHAVSQLGAIAVITVLVTSMINIIEINGVSVSIKIWKSWTP